MTVQRQALEMATNTLSKLSANEEDESKTLWGKIKRDPYVYVGFAGCLGTAGYGLYNFKNRKVSASLFLTRLRVVAQSVFVFTLTGAVAINLVTKHIIPKLYHSEEKTKEESIKK